MADVCEDTFAKFGEGLWKHLAAVELIKPSKQTRLKLIFSFNNKQIKSNVSTKGKGYSHNHVAYWCNSRWRGHWQLNIYSYSVTFQG